MVGATTTEVLMQGTKRPPCLTLRHHGLRCAEGFLTPTLLVVWGGCLHLEDPRMCAVVGVRGRRYVLTLAPVL
jgi:hypothetical protein